jgi:hypothetical protein
MLETFSSEFFQLFYNRIEIIIQLVRFKTPISNFVLGVGGGGVIIALLANLVGKRALVSSRQQKSFF